MSEALAYPNDAPPAPLRRYPMELIKRVFALLYWSSRFNPTQSSAPGGVTFMHSGRIVNVFSARDFGPAHDSGTVNDGGMLLMVIDEAGHLRLRAKRLLRST